MSEHTPGPYIAVAATRNAPGFRYDKDYGIYTEDGKLIAEVYQQISIHEHIDASHNANLFASAPDLLDACEAIWRMVVNVSLPGPVYLSIAERNALTAAIAKAKGQTAEVPA